MTSVTYLIAGHRSPNIVASLVRALSPSRVVVHIDAKVVDAPFREAVGDRPDVRFLDDRVRVRWAGWSQVETALRLMTAVEQSVGDDDYIALLSGDSFPLQPPDVIARFLAADAGRQYMSCVPIPVPGADRLAVREFGSMSRLSRIRFESDSRTGGRTPTDLLNRLELRRPYRAALGGRVPHGGGQWWTLTGAAVRWLLAESRRDPRFNRLCRTSAVPDEFYLPTLVMNSPFAPLVTRSLMYTDWRGEGWSPRALTSEHVERLGQRGLADPSVLADDFLDRHHLVGRSEERRGPVVFARKLEDAAVGARIQEALWPVDLLSGPATA